MQCPICRPVTAPVTACGPSLRTPPCLQRAGDLVLRTEQVGPCSLAARGGPHRLGTSGCWWGLGAVTSPAPREKYRAEADGLFSFALGPCPEAAPVPCQPSHSVPGSSTTFVHGCPGGLLLRVRGCGDGKGEDRTHARARARARRKTPREDAGRAQEWTSASRAKGRRPFSL